MENFLYEVLVRGVLPVSIAGVLAFFARQFLASKSAYKWRLVSTSLLLIVWFVLLFFFYKMMAAPYVRYFCPENSIMLGSRSSVSFDQSYWVLDSNRVASIPLYVRPNHLISLYIEFDRSPFEMVYKFNNSQTELSVNQNKPVVLHNALTDDLANDSSQLSSLANQGEESIMPFRFRVSTPVKMFSYEVHRIPTAMNLLMKMILFASLSGAGFSLIIYGIYKYPKTG